VIFCFLLFLVTSVCVLYSSLRPRIICENVTNSPLTLILEGNDYETAEHLHWKIDFGTILPGKCISRVVESNNGCCFMGLLNGKEERVFSSYTIFVGSDTKYHIY